MVFATKNFQEHILQVLDIYSCGFVQYMGMHMDFISYKVAKGTRMLLAHCTGTWKHHQKMFSMTLLANYQNIASTGNQNYSRMQGSSMTFFDAMGHKYGICFKSGRVFLQFFFVSSQQREMKTYTKQAAITVAGQM